MCESADAEVFLKQIKSNKIDRFAMAPHYHSSGAPNTMTLNRDKNEYIRTHFSAFARARVFFFLLHFRHISSLFAL